MSDGNLSSLYFIDSLVGWVGGSNPEARIWDRDYGSGLILKTEDGGINWIKQPGGTVRDIQSVFFVNNQIGWAVGDNGVILHSNQQYENVQPYLPKQNEDTVRVAIVDTGVDIDHYALRNALGYYASSNITCYSDYEARYGYDYVRNGNEPKDVDNHGTGVNGAIVRSFPDSVKLELVNLKFYEGYGGVFDAVCAIYHAIGIKSKVINLSWGFESDGYPGILHDALKVAQDSGILIITSAGNIVQDNDTINRYPANFELDNIITVTAYEERDNEKYLAPYASYGKNSVDVAANGYIQTASKGGNVSEVTGTSMAAPLVTRTAAIILGQYPDLSYQQVRDCIVSTTDTLITDNGKEIKYGALNHEAALACAKEKAEGVIPIVERFSLINTDTNQEVATLVDEGSYSIDSLNLSNFSIQAHVTGDHIIKVNIDLAGAQWASATEHEAPYTLFGNRGQDYFGKPSTAGKYGLHATPYYLNEDSVEVPGKDLAISFTLTTELSIAQFRLVGAPFGTPIQELKDSTVLNLHELPRLVNIVADVDQPKGSMVLKLTGARRKTMLQNVHPYALFGDWKGGYFCGKLIPGEYSLTATRYSEPNARGNQGPPLTVHFSVVDSGPESRTMPEEKENLFNSVSTSSEISSPVISSYPNPVSNELHLEWSAEPREETVIVIHNLQGIEMLRKQFYNQYTATIDLAQLPAATYVVRVITDSEVSTFLIIKGNE